MLLCLVIWPLYYPPVSFCVWLPDHCCYFLMVGLIKPRHFAALFDYLTTVLSFNGTKNNTFFAVVSYYLTTVLCSHLLLCWITWPLWLIRSFNKTDIFCFSVWLLDHCALLQWDKKTKDNFLLLCLVIWPLSYAPICLCVWFFDHCGYFLTGGCIKLRHFFCFLLDYLTTVL